MKVDKETVKYIANLSKLKVSEDEIDKYSRDLSQVVQFAEVLEEVDISGTEPTAHVLNIFNVFRKDIVEPSYDRDLLLANAPSKEAGCYSVPKVVE
jgi:aspartyl-tRNA(Asn)/glutamyl-tRNA(Gln) amidotransferase subunit C